MATSTALQREARRLQEITGESYKDCLAIARLECKPALEVHANQTWIDFQQKHKLALLRALFAEARSYRTDTIEGVEDMLKRQGWTKHERAFLLPQWQRRLDRQKAEKETQKLRVALLRKSCLVSGLIHQRTT